VGWEAGVEGVYPLYVIPILRNVLVMNPPVNKSGIDRIINGADSIIPNVMVYFVVLVILVGLLRMYSVCVCI